MKTLRKPGVLIHFIMLMAICEWLSASPALAADFEAIPLWPAGAPGSEARINEPEKVDAKPGQKNVSNVHHPSITPFLPAADKATGTAIIIAPGGGHRVLCFGHEYLSRSPIRHHAPQRLPQRGEPGSIGELGALRTCVNKRYYLSFPAFL